MSSQLPQIPHSALSSHSPPLIAPPDPPPSTVTPPDPTAPQRPIIRAVPPSNVLQINMMELTEIIAARQRQERAWHIRLSICASIYSNIDSTLSIYKEDIEREEAEFIRKYLREAIACLASANNAPKPPKIPIASKPKKMQNSNKTTATKQNKPLIAIPRHLTCSNSQKVQADFVESTIPQQQQEMSWVTVTRNGHKKSWTLTPIVNPQTEIRPVFVAHLPSRPMTHNKDKKKKAEIENNSDNRLFVRLPLDHEWRKISPAGLREVMVKRLSISPASIGFIKPVRSGFALTPCNMKYREDLLSAAGGLFMSGASLDPTSNWVPVLVSTVPKTIVTTDGQVEVSKSMLIDEIERVSSKLPALVKLYGTKNPEALHRTWLALFSEAPRTGFRVFDESGITKIFKKKQPIEFFKRCNGHHSTRNCSRAPSCGNCGSTMHSQDVCMALTKCRNCGRPHRSDSHRCLARPTRFGKPTKEQLKAYRRAGDREYQAVVRANAAEARATIAENPDEAKVTPSSSQETIISVDNLNETPVNTQTGEEMRL